MLIMYCFQHSNWMLSGSSFKGAEITQIIHTLPRLVLLGYQGNTFQLRFPEKMAEHN
nr:unnamed protein product [Callosobruchus analis]